jgi:hypothetical protein
MIIYNVTTQVAHSINDVWVEWMKLKHIPEIMDKGCFIKYQFVKLLDADETEGATYAVQFYAETKIDYERYIELYAKALREDVLKSWGNKIIAFRSLMEVMD